MNDMTIGRKMKPAIEAVLGLGKSKLASSYLTGRMQMIYTAAGAAALLVVLWWAFSGTSTAVRYVSEPATVKNLTVIVTATGTVQPTNKVDISSELSGTIRKVLVDYNSRVKVGQVLAELDTDKLKATVESSRAKLAASKARVKDAEATLVEKKLDFERKTKLVARQVTAEQGLEVAEAAYARAVASLESAKADVAAAEADLKLNETNLGKTCICSPIEGVVLNRDVEPGQTVATSLQAPVLFTIAEDLTKMELQVDVDEADVGKVQESQRATFTVDAYPDRQFSATIRELRYGSEIVQGVVTYKAVLTTDNADMLLRPGMTATAEIIVQEVHDALTVPNAALRYSPPVEKTSADNRNFLERLVTFRPPFRRASVKSVSGDQRVLWIVGDDGKPFDVAVTIGPTDGSRTQVVGGKLKPGQAVIVDAVTKKQ